MAVSEYLAAEQEKAAQRDNEKKERGERVISYTFQHAVRPKYEPWIAENIAQNKPVIFPLVYGRPINNLTDMFRSFADFWKNRDTEITQEDILENKDFQAFKAKMTESGLTILRVETTEVFAGKQAGYIPAFSLKICPKPGS